MLILWALLAATGSADIDRRVSHMAALYDRVCLKAFPDDQAVAALMTAENARELAPEDVKITMLDDPARGWALRDGTGTVWLEFPPFHACSVRWNAPQIGDLKPYRAIVENYESALTGFQAIKPYDADKGIIHIHAIGEQRVLPDRSTEALFVFDQKINDPKRRVVGETGLSLRFVHQITSPQYNN